MATRQSKCTTCKESFPTEEMSIRAGKKYCAECFKIKEKSMDKKKSDWDILFKCICDIYKIKVPTGMMFQQLKQFRGDGYNYTDIGMYYTLKYFYETLENQVKEDTGLGIIPFYYEKAKKHFSKVFDMQDLAESILIDEKIINIRTKHINKIIKKIAPLSLNIVREEDGNENID